MSALTLGVHHVGLTVSKLEESAQFFTDLLGWKEVNRNPDYPVVFVSDGHTMLTLWAAKSDKPLGFDRKTNVGLHHLALAVESEDVLQKIHDRLLAAGVSIEFSPELVHGGPAKHMMCFDPSGIRVEFFWPGQ
jgi:catechol 2,3-dioxygenase-like lactoylglutathione lyase family enzyme